MGGLFLGSSTVEVPWARPGFISGPQFPKRQKVSSAKALAGAADVDGGGVASSQSHSQGLSWTPVSLGVTKRQRGVPRVGPSEK